MKLILLVFMGTLLFSWNLRAEGRGSDGGNGDMYGQAFQKAALEVADLLAKEPLAGVDVGALLALIDRTKVTSLATVQKYNRATDKWEEKSAINSRGELPPEQKFDPDAPTWIVVSRSDWDKAEKEPHKRFFLAAHEYFELMGLEGEDYKYSKRLDRADVCSRTPAVRKAIEQAMRKSCYRIVPDDLRYITELKDIKAEGFKADDFRGLSAVKAINVYLTGKDPARLYSGMFRGVKAEDVNITAKDAVDSRALRFYWIEYYEIEYFCGLNALPSQCVQWHDWH